MDGPPSDLDQLPVWFLWSWEQCAIGLKGCLWRRPRQPVQRVREPIDFWSLNLLVAGRVTLVDGNQREEAAAPVAWLLPPHHRTREAAVAADGGLTWWTMHFTVVCAPMMANPLSHLVLPALVPMRDAETCGPAMHRLAALCPEWKPTRSAACWGRPDAERLLLRHLVDGFASGSLASDTIATAPPWLRDLHRWIRVTSPQRLLTPAEVVRRAGYSHAHVAASIRRCFGTSLSDLLRGERMRLALQFLREHPDQSVGEIAGRLRYRSTALFCRHFRAAHGCSPGRWRRLGRADGPDAGGRPVPPQRRG